MTTTSHPELASAPTPASEKPDLLETKDHDPPLVPALPFVPPTEPAPVPSPYIISNVRLIVFALSQLTLWGAHAGGILMVSFAIPTIQKEFKVSDAEVQWVAASYMLTWGSFQLIAGRLCDVFGRKRGFILGVGSFAILNIIATFMPNLASLNVVRALTGLSSAISLPASSGIVGSIYPPGRKRTLAFVAVTCGGCAGAASAQLLAGAFIQWVKWTWRPSFLLIGIICLFPIGATILIVPADPLIAKDWAVDWLGAFSIGATLLCILLTFTLSQTSSRGWSTPYLPALLVLSALLFALFVWRQRQLTRAWDQPGSRKPPPLIPHGLLSWKNRNILMIYLAAFFTWATTDSIFVFISYLYFDVLDMQPFQAGLRLSVTFFSGTAAAVFVALTISIVPPRLLMTFCCLISTASSIVFALRKLDWPYWQGDLWAFLVVAYGTDALIAAGSTIISQTALPEDQSVAASLFQTSVRLGFAVGLAITSLVRDAVEKRSVHRGETSGDAALDGLRAAFWTCAGFMVLATGIIAFGMKGWHYLDKEAEVPGHGSATASGVSAGASEAAIDATDARV